MKSVLALAILAFAGNVRSQLLLSIPPSTPYSRGRPSSSAASFNSNSSSATSSSSSSSSTASRPLFPHNWIEPPEQSPWPLATPVVDDWWTMPPSQWPYGYALYPRTETNAPITFKTLAAPALESAGAAAHVDTPLIPLGHEHASRRAATKSLQWIGPIAPNGEVYAYYGSLQDVSAQWVEVNNRFANPQFHHVEKLEKRKKSGIVCSREDKVENRDYAETWAAYKLAAVLGSMAATNSSAVIAIDGGHGHCVDLTACDEHERGRIQLCNDNKDPISVKVKTIAEYVYAIIYECAKQDGSGLIWGQQFDSKNWNVIVSACPSAPAKAKRTLGEESVEDDE